MWRSLYVRMMRKSDVATVPAEAKPTWAVRWSRDHKTRRHVGMQGVPTEPKVGFITCPWVLELLGPLLAAAVGGSASEPLFPDEAGNFPSYNYLVKVLRLLLEGLPGARTATLHGLRLGNDIEMKLRGVEEEVRDWFGWWKRIIRRMGEHYEAIVMAKLAAASEGYGSLCADALLPGVVTTVGEYVSLAQAANTAAAVGGGVSRASGAMSMQWATQAEQPLASALPRGQPAPRQTVTCTRCTEKGYGAAAEGHIRSNKNCPSALAEAREVANQPGDDASESGSDSEDDKAYQRPVAGRAASTTGTSLADLFFRSRAGGT